MYITSFDIDTSRRNAKLLLSSRQRMHAAIMHACSSKTHDETQRVLWRLDSWPKRTTLIMLSPHEPNMQNLQEQAGWLERGSSNWKTLNYDPVLQKINDGDIYGFRLTANPTHTAFVEKTGRKQRLGHVTVKQQIDWLLSKAERIGVSFSIGGEPRVELVERDIHSFTRAHNKVTLSVATFQGTLEICDKNAFSQAVSQGIGPAKAYGCGLLTIAPFKR